MEQENGAIYCRLSQDDGSAGESGSIQTQKTLLTQYCKEHNIRIADYYCDDGWSGTNFERPEFKRMIDDIENGKINTVIVKDLSRFGREYAQMGLYIEHYKYEKMYVIRPQFFIPIITLLRNAALNSLKYQQELQIVKNQQLDILHFEENMNAFKEGFARNYRIASERFNTAIDEIDKTITHLQKIKDALLSSENNLRLANNKAEDLSIKKLTKNAPSVKAMFDEQRADGAEE